MNILSVITIHTLKPDNLTTNGIKIFLWIIPIIIVGNVIGDLVAKKINTKQYQKLIFIAIIGTGVVSITLGLSHP